MYFHCIRLWFSVGCCALLSACLSTTSPQTTATSPVQATSTTQPLKFDPKIEYGQLENGLRYYILPNHQPAGRVYIRLVVNAGSLHEEEDQRGVAHIVEHLAFNGSKKFPKNQIIQALEQLGMKFARDINAFTDFENTVYTLNLADNQTHNLSLAFDVLDQWMNHLTLLPEDLEAERGIVLEEWRARLSPMLRLGDKKSAIEMAGSRYAQRDPIGLVSVIKNVSAKRVADFYHKWYRPDNMAVVIVGDIDKHQVRSLIQQKLSTFHPNKQSPLENVDYHIPLKPHWQLATLTEPQIYTPTIELSFNEDFENQDNLAQYREQFMQQVVIRLLNLRLQHWEKEQKGVETANFYHNYLGRNTSQFIFSIPLQQESYQEILPSLFRFLAEINQHGFSQQELNQEIAYLDKLNEKQQKIQTGSLKLADDMMISAANKQVILGEKEKYRLNRELLKQITLAEIHRTFQRIIGLPAKLLLITQPYPAKGLKFKQTQVEQWWQQAMNDSHQAWQSAEPKKQIPNLVLEKGQVQLEKYWQQGDIREFRLSNGSKLIYYYTDKSPNQVYFKALTPGGLRSVPANQYHLLRAAVNVVDDSGAGELSQQQVQTLLGQRQIVLSTFIDDYYQGFTGVAKTPDVEDMLKLFRFKLGNNPISERAMQQYQHETKQYFEQMSPEIAFMRQLNQQRFPAQETVYSQQKTPLLSVTAEELTALYQKYIVDKTDFTYFIAGDMQESQVKALAEKYLAAVPIKVQQRNPYLVNAEVPMRPLIVQGLSEPRAEVELFFTVKNLWQAENEFLLDLLGDILQEKLRLTLRENDSGIYSSNSWFSQEPTSLQIEGKIEFSCDPQRADELLEKAYQVVDDLMENGVDPLLLRKKVAEKHTQLKQQFDSLLVILGLLEQSYRIAGNPSQVYLYQRLDQIATKANIDAMAKKALQKSGRFHAILKP